MGGDFFDISLELLSDIIIDLLVLSSMYLSIVSRGVKIPNN